MKLENHIATRFLTDDLFVIDMVKSTTGAYSDGKKIFDMDGARRTYRMMNSVGQKAYYITDTVLDKLKLLKIGRGTKMNVRKQDSTEILKEIETYDWSLFYKLKNGKTTFIFPDNSLFRMFIEDSIIWFCLLSLRGGEYMWTFFYIDKAKNTLSENWMVGHVQNIEEFIYRLLCFFYLSENEEVVVNSGHRYGTKKSGKLVNTLPFPVTVVNSKWNVTVIRTEGFPVSGHFRLQPTKTGVRMIMIEPYMKHGYIRHAKKDTEL